MPTTRHRQPESKRSPHSTTQRPPGPRPKRRVMRATASSSESSSASRRTRHSPRDPELALLYAVEAVRSTAHLGFATEDSVDSLHWALQQLGVQYPVGAEASSSIRSGPTGLTGVFLLPPAELVALAEASTERRLTDAECQLASPRAAERGFDGCPARGADRPRPAAPIRRGELRRRHPRGAARRADVRRRRARRNTGDTSACCPPSAATSECGPSSIASPS